jgi:hypothetical protein
VVNGIKASISAIYLMKEGEQMYAAKHTLQRAGQQLLEFCHCLTAKAVYIGDQLDFIAHVYLFSTSGFN